MEIYQEKNLERLVDKRTSQHLIKIQEGVNKKVLKLQRVIKKQKQQLRDAKKREEILKKWTAFLKKTSNETKKKD